MTGIAISLALWAGLIAMFALVRPVEGRHVMTMRLSLNLLRYDEGLAVLESETRRSETWWVEADPRDLHLVERALSMWDLAAWYAQSGRVDRRAVLDVFSRRAVDLWERPTRTCSTAGSRLR